MKFFKVFVLVTLIVVIGINSPTVLAAGEEIITFGADLDQNQRDQLYNQFLPVQRPQILEVTNAEEYVYLNKYIPKEQIGSRAISSVYLQTLASGSGIKVETQNITWVTGGMYANAAVTAGIKDVLIKAFAPFPVSGTAALTGIFKAFEEAKGNINQNRKDVAYEELVTTGELGEKVGQEKAGSFMRDVKKEVVEEKAKDPEEIRLIIERNANEYHIKLTPEQLKQIEHLMSRINRLDLNISEINNQLKSIETRVKGIQEEGQKAQGILAQILSLLKQLVSMIAKIFS